MGDLIVLRDRFADRSRASRATPSAFFFDLACPFSYLAAERVERVLGEVEWIPTAPLALPGGPAPQQLAAVRALAERRAAALRLPLVWPDRFPAPALGALRAAAQAAEISAADRFALAACRLAFCGGFDLEDPEILAEAAAASGVPLEDCLAAAGDPARDGALQATAEGLLGRGIRRLPALRIGRRWFGGEQGLAEAGALLRAREVYGSPLAPVG
jgi:2-hydroxychromene-2-carboxylate isomerase